MGDLTCCINVNNKNYSHSISILAQNNKAPNIWIEADSFAKSFYATILADLGQISTDHKLANATALEYFSTNLTTTVDGQSSALTEAWQKTNPATQSYS